VSKLAIGNGSTALKATMAEHWLGEKQNFGALLSGGEATIWLLLVTAHDFSRD